MIIGAIKEQTSEETRTALIPEVVKKLTQNNHRVLLEKNIGKSAGFSDNTYQEAGAEFIDSPTDVYKKSQIILQVTPPPPTYLKLLTKKQLLITDCTKQPHKNIKTNAALLCLECVPRVSKAQSIDILSSQSTVRGYCAALFALSHAPRLAPQLMTAAASIKAAAALVIGAGVTGLQAASVLKRQGCRVTISDINEQTKELAKSVGAEFAAAASPEELTLLFAEKSFIIATAASPNGSSPKIADKTQLSTLAPGAVVIDTTSQNIDIRENHLKTEHYTFYRNLNFERLAPLTASVLWANNMHNLINLIITPQNNLNLTSDIISPMHYIPKNKGES